MADHDQDDLDLYGPDEELNDEALYGEEEIDASLDEPAYQPPQAAPTPAPEPVASAPALVPARPPPPPAPARASSTTSSAFAAGFASLPPNPTTGLPSFKKNAPPAPPAPPPPTTQSVNSSGGQGSNIGVGLGSKSALKNDAVRPSDMEGEGKMFVGGLNWETTDEKLKDYFSKFGAIDACTIMRDGTGRSRGFAFLTFVDSSSVDKVLSQMHTVDGKPIDPKRAIPHDEHRKAAKIFVGGLHASTTIDVLRDFFSQFGQVLDAQVMLDRESSRSKGFGFVTFADEEACEKALARGLMDIEGKTVEVKKAQPRAGRDRDGGGGGMRSGGGRDSHASASSGPIGSSTPGAYTPMPMYGASASVTSSGLGGGGGGGNSGVSGGPGGAPTPMGGAQAFGMAGMMPGMMPGMMGGGQGGPVDPNAMANYFRMMSGMAGGMPGMPAMGRPGQPPMMNPQFMMPAFAPMMGGGSPMAGMPGMRPGMGMPMGMMGMRPPMMMGMPGMMGMGMPFMMPGAQGLQATATQPPNGPPSASISAISATPMRQTGSRSPNTAVAQAGGAGAAGAGAGAQGPGPARSNTRGQSHFKPY